MKFVPFFLLNTYLFWTYYQYFFFKKSISNFQDEAKAEREVVETLQKALQYCDMETPGPRQPIYQYRVACIHQRLASLYHNSYRNMAADNPRRKNILQLCKLHYERASKLLQFLEQHMDLLKSTLERVALSELLSKSTYETFFKQPNTYIL